MKKELNFALIILSANPDTLIESDLYRIKQIFNNLIGNALKFTKEGYIEIGYELEDQTLLPFM